MNERSIERRRFFGALAAATALIGCSRAKSAPAASPEPPADEWARVRAEFALSADWVHLSGFLMASHPRRVREAMPIARGQARTMHYMRMPTI